MMPDWVKVGQKVEWLRLVVRTVKFRGVITEFTEGDRIFKVLWDSGQTCIYNGQDVGKYLSPVYSPIELLLMWID